MNEFKKSVAKWIDIANVSADSVKEIQRKEEHTHEIKSCDKHFSELPTLLNS